MGPAEVQAKRGAPRRSRGAARTWGSVHGDGSTVHSTLNPNKAGAFLLLPPFHASDCCCFPTPPVGSPPATSTRPTTPKPTATGARSAQDQRGSLQISARRAGQHGVVLRRAVQAAGAARRRRRGHRRSTATDARRVGRFASGLLRCRGAPLRLAGAGEVLPLCARSLARPGKW
jgi:hypothetical protein